MFLNHNQKLIKPSRVVILGNGFIGSNLYKKLLEEKIDTICISRNELDLSEESSIIKLNQLLKPKDVIVLTSIIAPAKGKGVDPFIKNLKITKTVCKAIENIDISQLIYLSSDAVYGMENELISESILPTPSDLYGAAHLSRELMLKEIVKFPLAILRSTLVYGLNDPHNSYGPNRLRRMAFNNEKIVLFGKGEETRDYIFIDDLINLILLVILYKSEGLLNLATGNSISYDDLSTKISLLFENQIPIEHTIRKNAITHRRFNISLIKKCFPNFCFTSIDEGLEVVHQEELKNKKK